MKSFCVTILVGSLLAALVPISSARAESETVCTFDVNGSISPGHTMRPEPQTFTTDGETGDISCYGPINGGQPTRSGMTFGLEGQGGGTCIGSEASGTYSLTIPTTQGPVHSSENFVLRRVGLAGTLKAERFSAVFQVPRFSGDCLTTPLTEFALTGQGTMRNS